MGVLRDQMIRELRLRRYAAATQKAIVNPVVFGSAVTGAGTDAVRAGITRLLAVDTAENASELDAAVFKIDRGAAGE